MYYRIEFCTAFTVDLVVAARQQCERVRIHQGMRAYASVCPYVVETPGGPVEAADLVFEDGSVARGVRYGQFRFMD
jgi:hypothetical protein